METPNGLVIGSCPQVKAKAPQRQGKPLLSGEVLEKQ